MLFAFSLSYFFSFMFFFLRSSVLQYSTAARRCQDQVVSSY